MFPSPVSDLVQGSLFAQASLPGLNKVSGVLADGKAGMGIYHHLPQETYSSATAYKSYHFIDDCILSTGSAISRLRPGQQKEITTFIDQTSFKTPLTICINGKNRIIQSNETVDIVETITAPCWLHCGQKGYLILPTQKVQLRKSAIVSNSDMKRIKGLLQG